MIFLCKSIYMNTPFYSEPGTQNLVSLGAMIQGFKVQSWKRIPYPVAADRNDGELVGDTDRGAAKGAIVGGIAGDAGKGAAAGAVGGALIGGMQRRRR